MFVNTTPKGEKKGGCCPRSVTGRPFRSHGRHLCSERRRGCVGGVVGGLRLLQGRREARGESPRGQEVHHGESAPERDGHVAPGPRADERHRGHDRALEAHERLRDAVGAGRGPRGHRDAGGGGEAADEGRGQDAPRPGPRRVRGEGVGVEAQLREHDHAPAAPPGHVGGLEPRGVHDGREPDGGGEGGVHPPVREGQDLPQQASGELVLPAAHGDQRHW